MNMWKKTFVRRYQSRPRSGVWTGTPDEIWIFPDENRSTECVSGRRFLSEDRDQTGPASLPLSLLVSDRLTALALQRQVGEIVQDGQSAARRYVCVSVCTKTGPVVGSPRPSPPTHRIESKHEHPDAPGTYESEDPMRKASNLLLITHHHHRAVIHRFLVARRCVTPPRPQPIDRFGRALLRRGFRPFLDVVVTAALSK